MLNLHKKKNSNEFYLAYYFKQKADETSPLEVPQNNNILRMVQLPLTVEQINKSDWFTVVRNPYERLVDLFHTDLCYRTSNMHIELSTQGHDYETMLKEIEKNVKTHL